MRIIRVDPTVKKMTNKNKKGKGNTKMRDLQQPQHHKGGGSSSSSEGGDLNSLAGSYAKKALDKSQKRSMLQQRQDIVQCSPGDLKFDCVLGQGTFCRVYNATALRTKTAAESSSAPVSTSSPPSSPRRSFRNKSACLPLTAAAVVDAMPSSPKSSKKSVSIAATTTTKASDPLPSLQQETKATTNATATGLEQGEDYAIKCLRKEVRLSPRKFPIAAADLVLEGDILSRLDHENIIKLHGVSSGCVSTAFKQSVSAASSGDDTTPQHDDLGYYLVLERLDETLKDRLTKLRYLSKSAANSTGGRRSRRQIEDDMWSRIESIAIGIARGMEYLNQEKNVVVRDLKPENVGFNKQGQVKLFDLGFAREVHTCEAHEIAGSLRYMAPEEFKGTCNSDESVTTRSTAASSPSLSYNDPQAMKLASDVYSFGVLLWEICMLKLPYKKFTTTMQFQEKVMCQHWRPSLRNIPDKALRSLIHSCWDPNPTSRPNFTKIRKELERLVYTHIELPKIRAQQRSTRRMNSTGSSSSSVFSNSTRSDDSSTTTTSSSIGRGSKSRRSILLDLLSPKQRPNVVVSFKQMSVSSKPNIKAMTRHASLMTSQESMTDSVRSDSSRVSA